MRAKAYLIFNNPLRINVFLLLLGCINMYKKKIVQLKKRAIQVTILFKDKTTRLFF